MTVIFIRYPASLSSQSASPMTLTLLSSTKIPDQVPAYRPTDLPECKVVIDLGDASDVDLPSPSLPAAFIYPCVCVPGSLGISASQRCVCYPSKKVNRDMEDEE